MTWTVPTHAARTGAPTRVRCHCGREVWSDDMVDVRRLPDGLVPPGVESLCDGCWMELGRPGRHRHSDLLRHLGAPAELVTAHRRQEDRDGRV